MFIARQPIFTKNYDVFGYELLFRAEQNSTQFDGLSSMSATASVLGGLFESGLNQIVDDKAAFINFDAEFILSEIIELIDPSSLVIEVLEDVVIDDELIARLLELKNKGYKIALDDFEGSYSNYPLVPLANIIKFDLIATPLFTIYTDVQKALSQNKTLLAEKVETEDEFIRAKKMGFHLFQGYFFSKPNIIKKSIDKTTTKVQYARLISELKKPEPSYNSLAEIIEKDVNLAYRFMHVASTRSSGDFIYTIKKALTYMGLKEIERWIYILMIRDLGNNKPQELMRLSLFRTKFAESIAMHSLHHKSMQEASMLGLFSTIDAILDETMSDALSDIALPESIKDALVHKKGTLMPIFELFISYEQGDWENTERIANGIGISNNMLYDDYKNALKWTRDVMKMM